jgi:hypothetical protein
MVSTNRRSPNLRQVQESILGQGQEMKTLEERFWEKVGPHDDPNSCWLWAASNQGNGNGKLKYGVFAGRRGPKGHMVLAHRFVYELYHGPIPKGLTIDHVKARGCTSTLCVNPAHLEAVTMKENLYRGCHPWERFSRRTHCPKGHPYDEKNTYIERARNGTRRRHCRVCALNRTHIRRWGGLVRPSTQHHLSRVKR